MFTGGQPGALGEEKLSAIGLRIPFDETARLVVSTFYDIGLAAMTRELGPRDALASTIGNFAREGVSLSPTLSIVGNALHILQGGTGYDFFRNKPILSEIEQASTLSSFTGYMRWVASETGARNFVPFLFTPSGEQAKRLDDFFAIPLIGPAARRLMVVSNNGIEELGEKLYYAKYGRRINQDRGTVREYLTKVSNAVARKQEPPEPTAREQMAMERQPDYTQRLFGTLERRFEDQGFIPRRSISVEQQQITTDIIGGMHGQALMRQMNQ
jgi:hypothetical protein